MKPFLIITTTLFASFNMFSFSALPPEKPTLIVTIVIDNLSNEEIARHSHLLSNDGILKLQNEGTSFTNATYPYASTDKACDYASISTGTSPRYHGIVSNQWYLPQKNKFQSCIESQKSLLIGYSASEKGYDAKRIVASTIGDELKVNSLDKSKIFSVSLNETASVLLGGHTADGAFWLNSESGKWISSDYYMSWLPDWVNSFNRKNFADFYLAQDWTLSNKPSAYNIKESGYNEKTFPISLKDYKNEKLPYGILKSTPIWM